MTPVTDRKTADDALAAPPSDWSSRARSSAMDALRYTQFVGFMKPALQIAAFAVIAAVLAFFFFQRQPARMSMGYQQLGRVDNDLAMVKPRLSGKDAQGNPFVITADAAIQDARNPKRARLSKVEADLSMNQNGWINATAASGLLDMNAGALQLNGGIAVFSDQGYELHTASASVNLNQGVVQGHQEVTGQGPSGTLRSDAFQLDRTNRQLTLTGHVQMSLIGKKA